MTEILEAWQPKDKRGNDANDHRHNPEFLSDLEASMEEEKQTDRPRFALKPVSKMMQPRATNWLMRDFLPLGAVALIFGDAEAGKSLIVIDWAAHIALGEDWNGHRVKQGTVVYIAGEGLTGLPGRFKAWEEHTGKKIPACLYQSTIGAEFLSAISAEEVVQAIEALPEPPVAVFVDTLAANFGPGNENATEDMVGYLAGLRRIHEVAPDALLLSVHHPGHGDKTRSRGAYALKGALDAEYRLENNDGLRTLTCTKSKDFERPNPLTFELKKMQLPWVDEDGEFQTGPVLVLSDERPAKDKPVSLSARQRLGLDTLSEALTQHGKLPDSEVTRNSDTRPGQTVVHIDQWRDRFYSLVQVDGDSETKKTQARRKAFLRVREDLLNKGKLATYGDYFWLDLPPIEPGQDGTERDICPEVSRNRPGQDGTYV